MDGDTRRQDTERRTIPAPRKQTRTPQIWILAPAHNELHIKQESMMVLSVGDQVCITDGPEKGWVGEVVMVLPGIYLIDLATDGSRWFSQANCKFVVPYEQEEDVGDPHGYGVGDPVESTGKPPESMEAGPDSESEVDDLVARGFVVTVTLPNVVL